MAAQEAVRNYDPHELSSEELQSVPGDSKTVSEASVNGETSERDVLLPGIYKPTKAELTGQAIEAKPPVQHDRDEQRSPSWGRMVCWSTTAAATAAADGRRVPPSEETTCRICQDGDLFEKLVSPCRCSGTVGFVHVSCLNTWLQVTSRTTCELCGFPFPVTKRPAPFREYLRNPRANMDLPNLVCDLACLVVLTPLLFTSLYLSSTGALRYESLGQAGSLCAVITLLVALMLVYVSWAALAVVYHVRVWRVWRERHSSISMLCESQIANFPAKKQRHRRRSSRHSSGGRRGGPRPKSASRRVREQDRNRNREPERELEREPAVGHPVCTTSAQDAAILLAPVNRLSGWIRVNNRVAVNAPHPV